MISELHLIYVSFLIYILLNTVLAQLQTRTAKYGWIAQCNMQPNSNNCNKDLSTEGRFYYDSRMKFCLTFEYGYCDTNRNNFDRLIDCSKRCSDARYKDLPVDLPPEATCSLQPDFGNCNSYYPMFYFDISDRSCKSFAYSGCGGNANRFTNTHSCLELCIPAVQNPRLLNVIESHRKFLLYFNHTGNRASIRSLVMMR